MAGFIRSGVVREHDDPLRFAKDFSGSALSPGFEPPWPEKAHHSWSINASSTVPRSPVTLSETAGAGSNGLVPFPPSRFHSRSEYPLQEPPLIFLNAPVQNSELSLFTVEKCPAGRRSEFFNDWLGREEEAAKTDRLHTVVYIPAASFSGRVHRVLSLAKALPPILIAGRCEINRLVRFGKPLDLFGSEGFEGWPLYPGTCGKPA